MEEQQTHGWFTGKWRKAVAIGQGPGPGVWEPGEGPAQPRARGPGWWEAASSGLLAVIWAGAQPGPLGEAIWEIPLIWCQVEKTPQGVGPGLVLTTQWEGV